MISSKECPGNHPIHVVDIDMGSAIFYNSKHNDPEDHLIRMHKNQEIEESKEETDVDYDNVEKWFTMHFDGACSKEGSGAGIIITTPYIIQQTCFSYKFYFDCTNNIVEYEALILGIKILEKLGAKRAFIYGDFEMVLR